MAHTLPNLPYAFGALEPHIDAKTMEIHHGKHHQAYVTNANNALKDQPALANLDVNALIADLSKVWIIADVFSDDTASLRPGSKATVLVRELGKSVTAAVSDTLSPRCRASGPHRSGLLRNPDIL